VVLKDIIVKGDNNGVIAACEKVSKALTRRNQQSKMNKG